MHDPIALRNAVAVLADNNEFSGWRAILLRHMPAPLAAPLRFS
jgi:hypothetical protein